MADGEFRRGVGPEALPQGAATALNEAQPDEPGLDNLDIPVLFAPGEDDGEEPDSGLGENMQVLLDAPDPNYQAAAIPRDRQGRVPRYVVRHLPQLMAAVKDPDAPVTLRALYNAITRHLDEEMRRGA